MSSELTIPQDMMAKLAAAAKDAAAKERPAVGIISTNAGQLTFNGNSVPGSKLEAIVVASSYRNVWYAGRFDRNNIVPPNCFALSLEDKDMAPHDNVQQKPNETCDGCPYNEWKSDPNGGKGKACKQSRRLIVIPADAIDKGAEAVRDAEMARFDVPVTSVRNYSTFVNALAASASVPPYAAVVEISAQPDTKTQVKVNFRPMRVLPSADILDAVMKRMESAERLALEPYDETAVIDDEPAGAAAPAAKGAPRRAKF